MTSEARPDPLRGDSEESCQQDQSLAPLSRRRLLLIAVIVSGGIGLGLVECLRRPSEEPLPVRLEQPQQAPASPRPRVDEALPLPATPEQFVADAKGLADEMMASFPDNPQAFLLGGRIYYAFGDAAKAHDCWEQCLQLDPQFAQGWCSRGEAAWEYGRFAEAAAFFGKAIAYSSRLDQKQVFLLADSLMNVGRAEEAVAALEEAAKEAPLPTFGLFLLGNGYLELKQYGKAREQFEAALGIDPQSANVHYGLARAFAGLGQAEKAQKHREEYAKRKGQELARTADARPELRKLDWADVRPIARECYLNAGKIYAVHGGEEEAEKLWLRAVALDPQSPRPRRLLEMLYRQQGRPEEALFISRGMASEGR